MSTVQTKTYTPADLLAMPDSSNIELIDGSLVEKPGSVLSGVVAARIASRLGMYCRDHQLGFVLSVSAGMQCFPDDPNRVRKPDVSFVKRERLSRQKSLETFLSMAPDLAVEVICKRVKAAELNERVEEYLAAGVPLVWVVDPEIAIVIIHRKDGTIAKLHKNDEITGENVIPGFKCKVAEFFPKVPA